MTSSHHLGTSLFTRRAFHRVCGSAVAVAAVEAVSLSRAARGIALSEPSEARKKRTGVVLLLSGVIVDGGWSQLAYEGLERLQKRPEFKTAFAEDITLAQMQQVARGYSDDGFDLILGHGFEFTSALLDVAPDYPDRHYFVTSFMPQQRVPGNIMFIDLGYFDAAYAAGALAALISEGRRAVGFVGGEDDPTQQKIRKAFIAGAERTVSGIKGLGIITGDYNNAARGREAAATLIGNGADVIWHAADVTGLGAIQGAIEGAGAARIKVLGCYSDQTSLAPARMATSFQMNLDGMVVSVAEAVASQTFAGGSEWRPTVDRMWVLKAGANGDHNPGLISAAQWSAFQKIWSDLSTRKIDVSSILKAS